MSCLVATLGRLARLSSALEDLALYCGPARLSQSWSRISELLKEAERLADAGARQPAGAPGAASDVAIADRMARLTETARVVDEHAVGSARWWLAVHTLSQRAEGLYRAVAGPLAEPQQGGQRPLWPG